MAIITLGSMGSCTTATEHTGPIARQERDSLNRYEILFKRDHVAGHLSPTAAWLVRFTLTFQFYISA